MKHHHWQKGFFDLEVPELMQEAVEFVQRNVTEGNYPVPVAFSGGKDSICLAKVMQLSGIPYQLNYSFTGIDPPEVVRFIRCEYPHCVFWKPKRTFWQRLRNDIPPTVTMRWCCNLLKKDPAKRSERNKNQKFFGVRAEESPRRAKRGRVSRFNGKDHFYPLFYWNEAQIWEFIEYHDLLVPRLYDEGFNRIGCVVCPFHSEKEHEIGKRKWPTFYRKWEHEVMTLWWRNKAQGKTMYHNHPEDYLRDWYRMGNATWYKGKNQKNGTWLFKNEINS